MVMFAVFNLIIKLALIALYSYQAIEVTNRKG